MISVTVVAQDLPRPSPKAKVDQVVGLTDVSLEYSRPSVKGRTIWGELVPYDKVWRFGANECTTIRIEDDLSFGDKKLAAGYYSILATPTENGEWSIFINADTTLRGSADYDAEKDACVLKVKPTENSHTESMSITIENLTSNSAAIVFRWEKIRLELPFTVNTDMNAEKNIKKAIEEGEDLDRVNYSAASYYYNTKKDEATAMKYLGKSLEVKENHRAYYLKGVMAKDKDKMDEAVENWEKAVKLAKEAEAEGWADFIAGLINDEKAKNSDKN